MKFKYTKIAVGLLIAVSCTANAARLAGESTQEYSKRMEQEANRMSATVKAERPPATQPKEADCDIYDYGKALQEDTDANVAATVAAFNAKVPGESLSATLERIPEGRVARAKRDCANRAYDKRLVLLRDAVKVLRAAKVPANLSTAANRNLLLLMPDTGTKSAVGNKVIDIYLYKYAGERIYMLSIVDGRIVEWTLFPYSDRL